MSKDFKRFLGIMVFVMTFVMAAGCGKDDAEEKDSGTKAETAVQETDQVEKDTADVEAPEAAEEADSSSSGAVLGEEDTLTEEDIEALKASIRDAVISEYLEPNGIAPEEFEWPDITDPCWHSHLVLIIAEYRERLTIDENAVIETGETESEKVMDAVFSGILKWLDTKGEYDIWYFNNTVEVLSPYYEVIPSINIAGE